MLVSGTRFVSKALTLTLSSNKHTHGTVIRRNLGFSISLKDTPTGGTGNRTATVRLLDLLYHLSP